MFRWKTFTWVLLLFTMACWTYNEGIESGYLRGLPRFPCCCEISIVDWSWSSVTSWNKTSLRAPALYLWGPFFYSKESNSWNWFSSCSTSSFNNYSSLVECNLLDLRYYSGCIVNISVLLLFFKMLFFYFKIRLMD